jgi:hypothetical protein
LKINSSESVLDFTQSNYDDKGYGYLPLKNMLDQFYTDDTGAFVGGDELHINKQNCSYQGKKLNSFNNGFSFENLLNGIKDQSDGAILDESKNMTQYR